MALSHLRGFSPQALASPWMWPLAPQLARFREHRDFPGLDELEALLADSATAAGVTPLRPALQIKTKKKRKARGAVVNVADLYDVRIAERQELPTRPGDWHDFFNVLAFATWPRAKRALHQRQARLLRERLGDSVRRLPGSRTREQDALTLFDEGGVVLLTTGRARLDLSDRTLDLDALAAERVAAGQLLVLPFGHALFEHLAGGLEPPLAFPCELTLTLAALPCDAAQLVRAVDEALAERLGDCAAFRAPSGVRGLSLRRLESLHDEARRKLVPLSGGG